MERLTKLDKYGNPYTNEKINCRNLVSEDGINYKYVGYIDNFKAFDGKPIDKLSKLEDLEEELGISLEVLFKALKRGIYIIDAFEIIYLHHSEISLRHNGIQWLWETPYGAKIFAHYKITWSLTKEELE